jgi:hypothetical protein
VPDHLEQRTVDVQATIVVDMGKPGLREIVSEGSQHEPFCTVLRL